MAKNKNQCYIEQTNKQNKGKYKLNANKKKTET